MNTAESVAWKAMHAFPHRVCLTLLAGLAMISASAPDAFAGSSFTLVQDGAGQATIEVAEQPCPAAKLAARELQYFVERITGARLPIVGRANLSGVRIVPQVSQSAGDAPKRTAEGLGLKRYEHAILWTPGGVILVGHDAPGSSGQQIDYAAATSSEEASERVLLPGMFDDQGTLRATYDFLERFCGVRFYGPAAVSVVCPKRRTLTVAGEDVRREPSIPHVSGSLTWRWPLLNGQYGNPSEDALRLYERRLRLGGIPWYTNHTLHRYSQRFPRDQHPEFYAVGGKGGLCYSSAALARQVAQDAQDYFEGRPVPDLTLPTGSAYYPVVPEDAAKFCHCNECRRWLDPHENDLPRTPSGRALFNDGRSSHLWFSFVNQVARELRKTHPDKYLCTLAYESYFWYPTSFRLESNVAIAPCLQVRNYWHMASYANELGHYSRWVTDGRPVFLWNYYCFPEEPAVINQWHCFPGFAVHELAKLARRFARDGVLGTFFCGIGEQVDFYATLKLYDDATQDIDVLLDEFFRLYFGGASRPMQSFYTLIEETYANPAHWDQNGGHHQTEQIAWETLGTEALMERLAILMSQAEELATTPEERHRVSLWKTGVWEYMVNGRQAYLKRTAQTRPAPSRSIQ